MTNCHENLTNRHTKYCYQIKKAHYIALLLTPKYYTMKNEKQTTITATPNHSRLTFTLRIKKGKKTISKFRTYPMSPDQFEEALYNTSEDWKAFLSKSYANNYAYPVKVR